MIFFDHFSLSVFMKKGWIVLFLTPCLAWAQFSENEGEFFSFLEREALTSVPEEKTPNFCPQCGESLKVYKEAVRVPFKAQKTLTQETAEAPRSEKKKGGSSLRKIAPHTATQYSNRPKVTHRKPQNPSANVVEKETSGNEAQSAPSVKKQPPASPQVKKERQTVPVRPRREPLKPVQRNVVQSEVSSLEEEQSEPQRERLKSSGIEQRKKRACAHKKKETQRQFKESISSNEN